MADLGIEVSTLERERYHIEGSGLSDKIAHIYIKKNIAYESENDKYIPRNIMIVHMKKHIIMIVSFPYNSLLASQHYISIPDKNCAERICKLFCEICVRHGIITDQINENTIREYVDEWIKEDYE